MTKREVVCAVLEGKRPPYVPWHFAFTQPGKAKLAEHLGDEKQIDQYIDNHFLTLGHTLGFFEDLGNGIFKDNFGVVWDKSVDKDIGINVGAVLPEPAMGGYELPDPCDPRYFAEIEDMIAADPDSCRLYFWGFTIFERAWSLRRMENVLEDFYLHPDFICELFDKLADWMIAHISEVLKYDVDCIHLSDDWGGQHGMIMGPKCWKEFIYPRTKRIVKYIRDHGKFVMVHSCGDIDEIFDDLIEMGVQCYNPFQPEVMDIWSLLPKYQKKWTFFGGLSMQKVLPFGTPEEVTQLSKRLLEAGAAGGYIFAPSQWVTGDVPLANTLAFIEAARSQAGYRR